MSPTLLRALLASCLLLLIDTAQAFIDPPTLSPKYPQAGQELFLSIRSGQCDGFYAQVPGFPQLSRQGNHVRIVLAGIHSDADAFCNVPIRVRTFPIGSFSPGNYTLQVDRSYEDFFDGASVDTVGDLAFVVTLPAAVPTLSAFAQLLLILVLVVVALIAMRAHRGGLCMLLLGFCASAWAANNPSTRYVDVLLSAEPAAPSAEAVVNYFSFFPPPGGPPVLAAFKSVAPEGASFLLPVRATSSLLSALKAHPDAPRSKLERFLVLRYGDSTDMSQALASLQQDPYVLAAYVDDRFRLSSSAKAARTGASRQTLWQLRDYGWSALNVEQAWKFAGGYALVGQADSGLAMNHPLLRQFDLAGHYVGGNFVPAASWDVGWTDIYEKNVDEQEPEFIPPGTECTPNGPLLMAPSFAGHGTHTAGLIAANPANDFGVRGTCMHCGLAMWKVTQAICLDAGTIFPEASLAGFSTAVSLMSDTGIQVISTSAGGDKNPIDYCTTSINYPFCVAMAHAASRDVLQVAAAGNDRNHLYFPASDKRTISVGGFDPALSLWDESPVGKTDCPTSGSTLECGSNYTKQLWEPKLELMASAKSVLSTTYPGIDWNPDIGCGDSFGPGNGIGYCTGTSMSAPQVAGIAGILRSINPLVHVGKPVPAPGELAGIRTVLAQTTFEAQKQMGWSQTFGYGRPDAAAAVERMLGTVQGRTARNRVTPLFRFHGTAANDQLETISPQMAIAFAINELGVYQPQGALIPGYSALPSDPNSLPLPLPRANAFVLTTEHSPLPRSPTLLPLHMIERTRRFPVGCTAGAPGCNKDNRDFTLVTTTAEIEMAHSDGYLLRTIQGYIYSPCTPEPACIPPGAQAMYRECRLADDDCATFLESERAGYEAAGYISAYPPGSSKKMGYAYPSIDSDGDGLIDGFEHVIGTKSLAVDSDGDGKSDAVEFPMAEVSTSDPCGPPDGGNCPADVIFADGFG